MPTNPEETVSVLNVPSFIWCIYLIWSFIPEEDAMISNKPSLSRSSTTQPPAKPFISTPLLAPTSFKTILLVFFVKAPDSINHCFGTSAGHLPNVMYAMFNKYLDCISSGNLLSIVLYITTAESEPEVNLWIPLPCMGIMQLCGL